MIHRIQIESLYRAVRSSEAFRRFLRIVENAETEVEQEAATKYFRALIAADILDSKRVGLKRINAAAPRSAESGASPEAPEAEPEPASTRR